MEKTEPIHAAPVVICDAGPLIHLDELGCVDLLADFSEVLVGDAVWKEVQRHRPAALQGNGWIPRRSYPAFPEPAALEALAQIFSLHSGEREALWIALEHPKTLLLSDDTAARLAAGNLGIVTHGTIGILVRAIRRQQRTPSAVLTLLRAIPTQSTLHLRPSLLASIIQQVEDEA